MTDYDRFIHYQQRRWWSYADEHCLHQLDGGNHQANLRIRRSPVCARAEDNILTPPDNAVWARRIQAWMPANHRHRYFRSFRSSQALCQAVFGAVVTAGFLPQLGGLQAECGRPAFFSEGEDGWAATPEYQARQLGEPRPSSIDVLLSLGRRRVAVECKFTEGDFGSCSRTDPQKYRPPVLCDGSYSRQFGRQHRCSLAEKNIKYWAFAPLLFDWDASVDLRPCPLNETYQLARNAMVATCEASGSFMADMGFVTIIYDKRNPAFQQGGRAFHQLELARSSSRYEGMFRLLSWQRLCGQLASHERFTWLLDAISAKHGIHPT